MNHFLVKQLLLNSSYWVLNKKVVKTFGLETAFLLSNFAEAEQMLADKEGWFYQTTETVEDMTTLSRHKQDQCIKQLEEMNVLKKDIRGMPAKRYFKIDYECLSNLIVENQQTSMRNSDKLVCEKSATNKEHINKEHTNKEYGDFFEKVWSLYPIKKGKGAVSESTKKRIFKIGDEMERCIHRYIDYVETQRKKDFKEIKYQYGSTFFNSGYIDYLDENYEEPKKDNKPKGVDALEGLSIAQKLWYRKHGEIKTEEEIEDAERRYREERAKNLEKVQQFTSRG